MKVLQLSLVAVTLVISCATTAAQPDDSDVRSTAFPKNLIDVWSAFAVMPMPPISMSYDYSPKYLEAGKAIYLVDNNLPSWTGNDRLSQVSFKCITDGSRYRTEINPDKDGTVRMPRDRLNSPFCLFDGETYSYSMADGLALTPERPYLGFPLPMEILRFVPMELSPGQCPNWEGYTHGSLPEWLGRAVEKGKIITDDLPNNFKKVMAFLPKNGRSDYGDFLEIEVDADNPLIIRRMSAGNMLLSNGGDLRTGRRGRYSIIELAEWTSVGRCYLPKRIVATVMLNMALSMYRNDSNKPKLERLRSLGVKDEETVKVFEHRLDMKELKLADDFETQMKVPLRPGLKIYDQKNKTEYIWGQKLERAADGVRAIKR